MRKKVLYVQNSLLLNDAFPEPENAGYSLGSECYYMKAYDSMAKIEKLLHGENEKSKKWSKISEQLCEKIP